MKKIYILLPIIFMLSSSANALCPINNSSCTGGASAIQNNSLQDKYIPNPLNTLQTPNTFAPQQTRRYDSMRMNSGEDNPIYSPEELKPNIINNCQFGVCLP